MDEKNTPGSSNAPADGGDHFARNPDSTITNPQPADPLHVASAKAEAEKATAEPKK